MMRKIHFEGPRNVRDLGGIRSARGGQIRRGRVIRGDGLARMTDSDRQKFTGLGVGTIIDLRTIDECNRAPSKLPANSGITVVHHGFMIEGSFEMFDAINNRGADASEAHKMMASNYARMPNEHSDTVRDVFSTLAREHNLPCYIHCTSGKDRTGLICALLLLALDVSETDVIDDYVLSNVEHQAVDVFSPGARTDAVEKIMSAHEDFMRAALDSVRKSWGNFENYFDQCIGFDSAMRNALAEIMLE